MEHRESGDRVWHLERYPQKEPKSDFRPADSDGLYSTQQICEALFGAMHQKRLRTQRQITERITLENQITRREVLNRSELMKVLAQIADAMVSRIMVSELSRPAKASGSGH
jgi:hypothetical protein